MERQLVLMDELEDERYGEGDWRLDEHTKEIGRQGLAEARRALADARRRLAA
ncbi:MAG TPA: hypothetical protein VFB78_11250 [Acidimicrobiales bacterium]|nr:hypothetical protein [Acidimicrobiales bacterium]